MNTQKFLRIGLLAAAVSTLMFNMISFGGSEYGPGYPKTGSAALLGDVRESMLVPDYWTSGPEYKKVLLSREEIRHFNELNFLKSETCMEDLSASAEYFDGLKMRENCTAQATYKKLYLNGVPATEAYFENIRNNILSSPASGSMPVRYGIAVNRTVMKSIPCDDFLSDAEDDSDWDELTLSAILVGEPVTVYLTSGDGRHYLVHSEICQGWVPAEDIAVCRSKEEWLEACTHEHFLVVTGDSVTTEESAANPGHSARSYDMGTVLELSEGAESIDNRMSWYSYIAYVPERDASGMYYRSKILIPMSRDVHIGYLPFTQENLIAQAFKCLGNRYGWGGMLNSQDCSAFVRELYLCFGMKLPRNTSWQAMMPVKITDISKETDAAKTELLKETPPGAILQFPGHEMLYLGCIDGKCYTINNVSSLCFPSDAGNVKYRGRSVIVNELGGTYRANGKTWLQSLSKIIVPWEKQ